MTDAHPFDQWATGTNDVNLDDTNRHYLIQPPNEHDLAPYLRMTSFIDVWAETAHLDRWRRRILLKHFWNHPHQVGQQIEEAINHPDLTESKALDELARQLHTDAGGDEKRDYGTEIHEALRCWVMGENFSPQPQWTAEVEADLTGIITLLEAHQIFIDPAYVEVPLALHQLRVAGRTDGITIPGGHGGRRVIDLKSGSISPVSWAMQLAGYAHADHIVSDEGRTLTPFPDDIDLEVGYIIHAPKGKGVATLFAVDLVAGWADIQLAVDIHRLRDVKQADRIRKVRPRDPVEPKPVVEGDKVSWLTDRVRTIIGTDIAAAALEQAVGFRTPMDLMAAWWPTDVPTLKDGGHTPDQLDTLATAITQVEAALGLAFPPINPEVEADNVRVIADDPRIIELVARLRTLPADLLAQVQHEAAQAGVTSKVTLGLPLGQLRALDEIVTGAEHVHASRVAKIEALLNDLPPGGADAVLEPLTNPAAMTAAQVDFLELLGEALLCGYLSPGTYNLRPHLFATDQCADLLTKIHGNKRNALTHTKTHAKTYGHTPPSAFADIVGDPLLVALALSGQDAPTEPVGA